jgi:hypothetical protein
MLQCVRQCHKNSVRHLRPEDCITNRVVENLIGDMLGEAEARSTAYKLYQRSKQLVKDAKRELEAARAEAETSSSSKTAGRPRRSSTVPNYDSRPPPPNPPPGFAHSANLHASLQNADTFASQQAPPNNNSHVRNPSSSNTISAPDGLESPHNVLEAIGVTPYVPNGQRAENGMIQGQTIYNAPLASSSSYEATHLSPICPDSPPSPQILARANEIQYEPSSQPGSQSRLQTTSFHEYPAHITTAGQAAFQGPRANPNGAPKAVIRPKPHILQGGPPHPPSSPLLPYLSLEDALEWRRKRKGHGPKVSLKNSQYLDRLLGRDHVSARDSLRYSHHDLLNDMAGFLD